MTLLVGSLFSGIGGFDYGLERAGMRVAWQCEADEFCRRVLAERWPEVPCYPDVRELRDPEPVDVLCGGFPCQDISLAGKGAGIDGARSGLWGEYARLVGELRPRYVIVENVAALLSRGLGRVVGDLAALGYDAEWDCIPASAVGAPHRRDRLWLVAYPAEGGRRPEQPDLRARESDAQGGSGDVADAEGIAERAGLCASGPRGKRRGRSGDGGSADRDVADSERGRWSGRPQDAGRGHSERDAQERREGAAQSPGRDSEARAVQDADERALQPWRIGGRAAQAGGPEWWAAEPPVGRVAHGVPDRLDQLAGLGNALVPQIAEWLGRRILNYEADIVTELVA